MKNLYTKLKIFHFKEKLDSLPLETQQILAPIHIRVKPTNICNHDCYYCAYRVNHLQLGKDMIIKDSIPEAKMNELIKDCIEMKVQAITFSGGGDPFCYPYFLNTIKQLSQSPIKFAALTNGSLLRGEIADLFAHFGSWVRISIDGWDDKSYADYRNIRSGEFTKVIQNMETFKKRNGKCLLGASIVVDKKNAPHIYQLTRTLIETGLDSIKISACIVSNSGTENNQYHKPLFPGVKAQIKKAIEDFSSDNLQIYDAYHELDEKFNKTYNWCPYLQILPVIGADQNVYSCHDKAYNLENGILGSIKDISFKELWYSDKNRFFKINPSHHCDHHCVVNKTNQIIMEYFDVHPDHLGFV